MDRLTEGALSRMRDHLKAGKELRELRDGPALMAWVIQAFEHLEELLDQAEEEAGQDGGTLARRLRDALEERILRELRGRAELTDETRLESLSVHVLPEGVIVDSRMRLGRWRQG